MFMVGAAPGVNSHPLHWRGKKRRRGGGELSCFCAPRGGEGKKKGGGRGEESLDRVRPSHCGSGSAFAKSSRGKKGKRKRRGGREEGRFFACSIGLADRNHLKRGGGGPHSFLTAGHRKKKRKGKGRSGGGLPRTVYAWFSRRWAKRGRGKGKRGGGGPHVSFVGGFFVRERGGKRKEKRKRWLF